MSKPNGQVAFREVANEGGGSVVPSVGQRTNEAGR